MGELPKRFGDFVRALREGAEMSQVELAAAAGVSQAVVSKVEAAERFEGAARPTTLEAIALGLNVPLSRLRDWEHEANTTTEKSLTAPASTPRSTPKPVTPRVTGLSTSSTPQVHEAVSRAIGEAFSRGLREDDRPYTADDLAELISILKSGGGFNKSYKLPPHGHAELIEACATLLDGILILRHYHIEMTTSSVLMAIGIASARRVMEVGPLAEAPISDAPSLDPSVDDELPF